MPLHRRTRSVVPGRVPPRVGTRAQIRIGRRGSVGGPHAADRKRNDAPSARTMLPRLALVAVALLSLALGAALQGGARSRRVSALPTRLHASSRLQARGESRRKGLASLPLGAQGPVSEALGADSPAYRIGAGDAGLLGANPGQHFSTLFDRSGVSVRSGSTRVRLSFQSIGFGAALRALGEVVPRASANAVSYQRSGLSERWVNGPLGLEQIFTVPKAPAGRAAGALTLSIALSDNARASLTAGGHGITIGRAGRAALRYSGLSASDAWGHALASRLELRAGRILLRVEASGARYPLRIDPLVQQGEKLTGGGERGEEGGFGFSAALSPGGEYALIGGPSDSGKVGAAWVFTRSGSTWTEQGPKLTGKEEAGAGEFGWSVALSEKGEYALIGGPSDNGGVGAAWVFTRSGTTWTQQARLTGKEEAGQGDFGWSVALASKEGNYAAIGAPFNNKDVGAAWVFTRSGTTWTQQAMLTGKEEVGEGEFGGSVALSATGEYALVGGPGNKTLVGAAWVFLRKETTWSYQATLTGKEEAGGGEFGWSVALSEKGEYALIGGPGNKEGVGAAWVLARSGTSWTAQATLTGAEETGNAEFGASVALAAEKGEYALIGGPQDKGGVGAAWVLTRSGSTWAPQAKLTGANENGNGNFGASVAISAAGQYALVGAKKDNSEVGAAWVFQRESGKSTWAQQGEKLTGKEEVREGERSGKGAFGLSVALSANGEYALIGGPSDNGRVGAAWVFMRSGTTWTEQGPKLTANEEAGAGEFGFSVALSEGGEYAMVGGPSDNERVGAAWVFVRSGTSWTEQGPKLTGNEEAGAGYFGYSVALASKEANYALIGGPENNAGVGAAWVFTRSGASWTQQAKLTGGGESGAGEFGFSVGLSANGEYALIGGPANKEFLGAAWVFLRKEATWAQQATLTGSGESGMGEFGWSVAVSANGEYALIGGPSDSEHSGAAWVLTRSGEKWNAQGSKLTGGKEEVGKGYFGYSVALASKEANYAVIGAPESNTGVGAAWVLSRSSSTWTRQAMLTGGGEDGAGYVGGSVAVSATGEYALVGAKRDSNEVGAAWAFRRETGKTTWTQQGEKLTGNNEVGEGELTPGRGLVGFSVALSSDGNTALVGGRSYMSGIGAAWVFTRSGTTWTQQAKLTARTGEEVGLGAFGSSVALSSAGSTALVGTPAENGNAGAVWVFTRSGESWTQQGGKLTGSGETGAGEFGTSVALSSVGSTALVGSSHDSAGVGAVWVFTRSGESWTQQGGKLTGGGEVGAGEFGASAALSSDGNTALVGGSADSAGVGAVWVFTRSGEAWIQQGGKLTGGGEVGAGEFGASAALSSGGSTALVGGSADGAGVGAAWVFTRSGESWAQQGVKLTGAGETGAGEFAASVALSSSGNTALIGGPADNGGRGGAWLFMHSGATWAQQGQELLGGNEAGMGEFGASVALSAEGNTAMVGAPGDNGGVGGVWAFINTSPGVETRVASSVGRMAATLNAGVNPNGVEVSRCEFEYGATVSYGKTVSCASLPGAGEALVAVSAALTGLASNTTYHYRVSAMSAGGTSKGADQEFKTTPVNPTQLAYAASVAHYENGEIGFRGPNAVAVDVSGNVWVADAGRDVIAEYNAERKFVRQVGEVGSGQGQFEGIGGIATNASGDLYVTDPGDYRVEEFGPAGEFLRSFSGGLSSPGGVAVDSVGNVWVLNSRDYPEGGRVVEFSATGSFLSKFGSSGAGEGQLGWAYGLAFSGGNLYVAEDVNQRVQEFSTAGAFIRQFDEKGSGTGKSNQPYGIASDPGTGNLYVTEVGNNRVQAFSPTGGFIATFGTPGSGAGQFSGPQAVAVSPSGNVYVADTINSRVEEWAAP